MKYLGRRSRAVSLALMVGVAGAGCSDFLEVTNPGAIENPTLNNPEYLQLMYDGVVGDFQPAYAWTAFFSGAFTDELRMHHSYFENLDMDERAVTDNNGTYALAIFNGLHRARFMADTVAGRYRALLGDSAEADPRYPNTLMFAGYSYALLGEQICETRIGGQGAALQPDELFAIAIDRFDAAIAAAAEVRAGAADIENAETRARIIAGADSAENVARVGAARAALNAGNTAAAIAYAEAVTPAYVSDTDQGFRYDVHYKQGNSFSESRRMGSPFWEFLSAGASWVSISGTPFENLNDPRVPHGEAGDISVSGGGDFIVPNAPRSFNTYDGTVEGSRFVGSGGAAGTESTIRLASAIEARYIIAEAEGLTPTNLLFLNEQRAIGNQVPLVAPTEEQYMAALREQRAREFFLDGHRLGDLRRYEDLYGVDLWPTGAMYGSADRTFGTQKCWPTPVSESF
ncbi:MAG TPA: hypothetical protein VHG09_07390 [Longimicrobiales bacterium]|nr:hypothetical protein [Longimicrobiales bacterium]